MVASDIFLVSKLQYFTRLFLHLRTDYEEVPHLTPLQNIWTIPSIQAQTQLLFRTETIADSLLLPCRGAEKPDEHVVLVRTLLGGS